MFWRTLFQMLAICLLLALTGVEARSQVNLKIPLFVSDARPWQDTIYFGLHSNATSCLDTSLGENGIPPDALCDWGHNSGAAFNIQCSGAQTYIDYHQYKFTAQADTYRVIHCTNSPTLFRWQSNLNLIYENVTAIIWVDTGPVPYISIDMLVQDSLLIHSADAQLVRIITKGIKENVVGIGGDPQTPEQRSLEQNYPNPFNPSTVIRYSLSAFENVTIMVYDLLGREIATLVNEQQEPGIHSVVWDASGTPAGVYYYKLNAGVFSSYKKMVLLR